VWNAFRHEGVSQVKPPVEGRPLDEDELVAKARRGEIAAYEELVRIYQTLAFRTAYVIAGSAADAEDAAQSGFVKAYYALDRFREGAPFRPWLLRIVANEARNLNRSAGRRTGLALRLAEDRPRDDAAPSPEAAVLSHARSEQLIAAMNKLKEKDRQIISLRYLLELSEAETAEILAISVGTVKSRLSRALDRLRGVMPVEEVSP
jgi:RNA polymerase sigma factor (sigma-70 family)